MKSKSLVWKFLPVVILLWFMAASDTAVAQCHYIKKITETVAVKHKEARFKVNVMIEYPDKCPEVERLLSERLFGAKEESIEKAYSAYLSQFESTKRIVGEGVSHDYGDGEVTIYAKYFGFDVATLYNTNVALREQRKMKPSEILNLFLGNDVNSIYNRMADSYIPIFYRMTIKFTDKSKMETAGIVRKPSSGMFTYDMAKKRVLNVQDVFTKKIMEELNISNKPSNENVMVCPFAGRVRFIAKTAGVMKNKAVTMGNCSYFVDDVSDMVFHRKGSNRIIIGRKQTANEILRAVIYGYDDKILEASKDGKIVYWQVLKGGRIRAEDIMKEGESVQWLVEKDGIVKAKELAEDGRSLLEQIPEANKHEVIVAKEVESGEAEKPFDIVDPMPTFPGGDGKMMEWLSRNIMYPAVAEENGVQGRVIVGFVVGKDGSLSDVSILRSVDPELDKEALRVVKAMPRWNPGKQNGVPVPVRFSLPITFQL